MERRPDLRVVWNPTRLRSAGQDHIQEWRYSGIKNESVPVGGLSPADPVGCATSRKLEDDLFDSGAIHRPQNPSTKNC